MEEIDIYEPRKGYIVGQGNEMYFDCEKFEMAQRVAKMFASSTMVPDVFRNNVGNCMIVLNFAARVGLDPFMVFQKTYIIHGKPAIEAQLMIALINQSGRFTPLKFKFSGAGDKEQCTCYATEIATGEECEQTVTWEMVQAEGWDKKPGSKWKTLKPLMFQYRAAAFFGRLYCPEALLGMATREELRDIEPVSKPTGISHRLAPAATQSVPEETEPIYTPYSPEPDTNPLHETPEWEKYQAACKIAPDIAETLPVPTTAEQCHKAAEQINRTMDARNNA